MRNIRRLLIAGALALCVSAVFAASAGASGGRSQLLYDCGPITGEDCFLGSGLDMVGPTVGNVLHKQLGNGDLQIGAFVRRSDPNMSYGLQVLCGAVHNTGAVITLDFGSRAHD